MKKALLIIISVVMTLLLISCDKEKNDVEDNQIDIEIQLENDLVDSVKKEVGKSFASIKRVWYCESNDWYGAQVLYCDSCACDRPAPAMFAVEVCTKDIFGITKYEMLEFGMCPNVYVGGCPFILCERMPSNQSMPYPTQLSGYGTWELMP